MSLSGLLAAEAAQGKRPSAKSVIFIYLVGGPPTRTCSISSPRLPPGSGANSTRSRPTCPGSRLASTCRGWAPMMDKFTIIRSICDAQPEHNAFQS
ncbi:MAG: hypothetical protein Ct9H300mP1_29630 [Planctomycetaceae bacterium]|nr:MAG: hypothetical protein Ct9H300mP1_29630 [Planctomycetaceae bacterium]